MGLIKVAYCYFLNAPKLPIFGKYLIGWKEYCDTMRKIKGIIVIILLAPTLVYANQYKSNIGHILRNILNPDSLKNILMLMLLIIILLIGALMFSHDKQ